MILDTKCERRNVSEAESERESLYELMAWLLRLKYVQIATHKCACRPRDRKPLLKAISLLQKIVLAAEFKIGLFTTLLAQKL